MSFRGSLAPGVLLAALIVVGASGCGSSGSTSTSLGADPTTGATTTVGPPESTHGKSPQSTEVGTGPTTTTKPSVESATTILPDPPKTPTGAFLSSHELSLGAGDTPSLARSVCRTSPGVMCTVRFTMDDHTESLPAQRTDERGITSWEWSPASAGLDVGHWQVEIIASDGGAQSLAHEAMGLTVVP